MRVLLVKLGVVDIGLRHHFNKSNYSRHLGIAVVEESLLTNLCNRIKERKECFLTHFHCPHIVPGTVVSDAIPAGSAGWLLFERLKGEGYIHSILKPRIGFRLDQPLGRALVVTTIHLLQFPLNCFLRNMCYMPKLEQTKLDNITIKEEGRQSLFEVNKMEKLDVPEASARVSYQWYVAHNGTLGGMAEN